MSVLRKSPAERAWLTAFDLAFSEGRFKEAAELFDTSAAPADGPETTLRAAQAHMHSNPIRALHLLIKLSGAGVKLREQVQRDALLVEAFARTNDFESADARLKSALEGARKLGDKELVATVAYRSVRRHLQQENPVAAREALTLARNAESASGRIYALYAETLILPYEERVAEQARRLIEVLRLIDPTRPEFFDVRAWGAHTLAILARDLYIPDAVPEVERQLTGVPWPTDFAQNLFQALKALSWTKAMQGDYFNAFRHLKAATEAAPTVAWASVAACDRAYLARAFGEHRWSRVELDEAEHLADTVDWHATTSEEQIALLLLAELFSTLDTARSAMYLGQYRELGGVKSALLYRHDERRAAFARYATGVVELALGNKKRALSELREGRRVFERFGYDFRAARCILKEYEATGNRSLLPIAEEKLRNYRQSWLVNDLRAAAGPVRVALPPSQRRVFDEICKGKSTSEIAATLGRSEFTISNHIKQVFKTFGVKSRTALIAEAMRRGLLQNG
jgi:DNA-binding CsgD family transcriptional regulator